MFTQAQIDAIATAVATATVQALSTVLVEDAPAKTTRPKAVTQPKADPKPAKGYRSLKGREKAKAQCQELAVRYDLKVAGGTRTFKSLSAKEQKAYRTEQAAIWAAVPKTRSTKA